MLVQTVRQTAAGYRITLPFGPTGIPVEPAMWADSERAYWADAGPFPGATLFDADFHPGIDRAAVEGTPMHAMERGLVEFAGWKDSISGNQIEVAINDRAGFSINHLSRIKCRVGQHVGKDDIIGLVGQTGAATGPHSHESVYLIDFFPTQGIFRRMLYNPALFLRGGKYEDSDRLDPEERYFAVDGPGVNIRKTPIEWNGREDVFARSLDLPGRPGIYRIGTGNRIGPINSVFHFLRWADTPEGRFAVGTNFRRKLAVRESKMHFVAGP